MPKHISYEQVTGLSAVKKLTVPSNAQGAYIQAEAQNVRVRNDGTDPTAAVGFLLKPGDPPLFLQGDIRGLEFIEAVAGGIVNVLYVGL